MLRLFRKNISFFPSAIWADALVLLAGVMVYVGLAASTLTKFSIWFDEAFGSYLIRFNFADLTRYTANDVHPPLYYWLLKVWSMAFGNTEIGIRSMSVFFAAVTIVVIFLFVLRQFGRRAAYLSLALLVVMPFFVRYGQEARMYTLLTAIIALATYVLVYAVETKKRAAWVAYGVLLALGMLTQYFAALAWVAHAAWLLVRAHRPQDKLTQTVRRMFDKNTLTGYGVALLLFAFWLPFLVIQFVTIQGHGFWIKPVTTTTIPDFITSVLLFTDSSGTQSWLAVGVSVLVGTFVYVGYRLLRALKAEARMNYLLVMLLVCVPPFILLLLSMPPLRPAFVDRYLVITAVFMAVFMGVTLAYADKLVGRKVRTTLFIGVLALMAVGIVNQSVTGNYNRSSGQSNDTRQLLERIRAKAYPGTPILTTTPWIFYEASIYDNSESPIFYVNETTEYKYGSLTALAENEIHKIRDIDEFSRRHKDIWVIGNLRDTAPRPLRSNWTERESIVINDSMTKRPLFKATYFTVE